MVSSKRPHSWFGTIFQPGWPLLATCAVLIGFVALAVLGIAIRDYQLWFHIPAVVGILAWYGVMMKRYRANHVAA